MSDGRREALKEKRNFFCGKGNENQYGTGIYCIMEPYQQSRE